MLGNETHKIKIKKMFFPSVQDVLFADFTKMSLTQDSHDFAVQAINKLFSKSDKMNLLLP
jgi:hypothetical protein